MRRHLTSIFIVVAFVVAMCPKAGFGAVGDVAELAGVSVVQLVEDPGQPGRVLCCHRPGGIRVARWEQPVARTWERSCRDQRVFCRVCP